MSAIQPSESWNNHSFEEVEAYIKGQLNDKATKAQGAKADTALQKTDISTGNTNGTINVKGSAVTVKGLQSAAYTKSSEYATAAQGRNADTALQPDEIVSGVDNGTVAVRGLDIAVTGLGSAAYKAETAFATAAQGRKADDAATDIQDIKEDISDLQDAVGDLEEMVVTTVGDVQINTAEELPEPSAEYIDKPLKVGDDIYVCTAADGVHKFYSFENLAKATSSDDASTEANFKSKIADNITNGFGDDFVYEMSSDTNQRKIYRDTKSFHLGSSSYTGTMKLKRTNSIGLNLVRLQLTARAWSSPEPETTSNATPKPSCVQVSTSNGYSQQFPVEYSGATPPEVEDTIINIVFPTALTTSDYVTIASYTRTGVGDDKRVRFVNGIDAYYGSTGSYRWVKLLNADYKPTIAATDIPCEYTGDIFDFETVGEGLPEVAIAVENNAASIALKQDQLTAGTNITINDNVISATSTSYTAGDGISITGSEIAVSSSITNNIANAQNAAQLAQETASQAYEKASDADTAAQAAQTTANTANTAAQAAQTTANAVSTLVSDGSWETWTFLLSDSTTVTKQIFVKL